MEILFFSEEAGFSWLLKAFHRRYILERELARAHKSFRPWYEAYLRKALIPSIEIANYTTK